MSGLGCQCFLVDWGNQCLNPVVEEFACVV